MSYLIVPSDITVLEEKQRIGKRSLLMSEWLGLATFLPMYHNSYTKLDRGEMKAVLQKAYDPRLKTPENEICIARQKAVHRQVSSHIWNAGGALGVGGMTFWSFRKYNYQSKLIMIPFMCYVGSWGGRFFGDIFSSRHRESYRDRFLATLPAKAYYDGKS